MSAGWLILAIVLLATSAICMGTTAVEFALGKTKLGSAFGALVFHATVGFFGIWVLAIAAH